MSIFSLTTSGHDEKPFTPQKYTKKTKAENTDLTGRLRESLMRSSTLLVMVAEKSIVWRAMGAYFTSSSTSSCNGG